MPRDNGIYVVCSGLGEVFVAEWLDGDFWAFGCDEPFHYFPTDVPEQYSRFPSVYVSLIVREIVVEELNV